MIRYALTCAAGHEFESWFQSAAAHDSLARARAITCPVCGSDQVRKALMAPAVGRTDRPEAPATPPDRPLSSPQTAVEAALAALRRQIEETSDYVGLNFAAEARAMHSGETPSRPIWGEARPDEARALIDEGVPVAPLPFLPPRRTN